MRGRLRLLAFGLIANASVGQAQSLGYENVLNAEHAVGPRLSYQPMDTGSAPVGPPPAGPAEEAEGPVRSAYFDRIEYRGQPGGDGWSWDLSGEIGSAQHRLWLTTAGDASLRGRVQYVEGQALYSHPILDAGLALQVGIRRDFVRPRRTYGVFGVQGNLTEPLYVGAFAFASTRNDFIGRAFAYYDWEPAPRLVIQPYVGIEASARDAPELGIGRGLSSAELSLRIRYRIAEPFAPYVGVSWDRLLSRTARIARADGEDVEATSLVIGLRSYF